MARNAQLNLRIKPTLKAKLEKLAKQDRQTLSAYVERVLDEHVKGVLGAQTSRAPSRALS